MIVSDNNLVFHSIGREANISGVNFISQEWPKALKQCKDLSLLKRKVLLYASVKAKFPLGEFIRAKRIFSSIGTCSLIPTGATVFAGSFLFEKVSSKQLLLFRHAKSSKPERIQKFVMW